MSDLIDRLKNPLKIFSHVSVSATSELDQQQCEQDMLEAAVEIERPRAALEPFTKLGGPNDGVMPAFHDMEDDVVVYLNSGECITAGDVRAARNAFGILHAPKRSYSWGTDYGKDILRDLNEMAHMAGVGAVERDLLQRAFKEIKRLRAADGQSL